MHPIRQMQRVGGGQCACALLIAFAAGAPRLALAQLDPNDPWPKFGQDERNSCRGSNFGPHSVPELRWWAAVGDELYSLPRSGAAIASVNGVRVVLVPGNYGDFVNGDASVKVKIFRFHPCSSTYDPASGAADPFATIEVATTTDDEIVGSTPLVYRVQSSTFMVVQTNKRIRAYDISVISPSTICSSGTISQQPVWVFPDTGTLQSSQSSPAIGKVSNTPTSDLALYAVGQPEGESSSYLFCLKHDYGSEMWRQELDGDEGFGSPAIGPADEDPENPPFVPHNFVYVTLKTNQPGNLDFWAVFGDGTGGYSHMLTTGMDQLGTYGSPSVHDQGDVIVPCDNRNVVGFANAVPIDPETELATRWTLATDVFAESDYVSCTAGLFSDRKFLFWVESSKRVFLGVDPASGSAELIGATSSLFAGTQWTLGTPAIDAFDRAYTGTPNGPVHAFRNDVNQAVLIPDTDLHPIMRAWYSNGVAQRYDPPTSIAGGVNLKTPVRSGAAIDADGTLIVTNTGYVLALRPLRGDFDGDGCRGNFDVDPFVLALIDTPAWQTQYGVPLGINLLGVGDCNNDGFFNNYDIDCFVDLVLYAGTCPDGVPDEDDVEQEEQRGLAGGTNSGEQNASAAQPTASTSEDWDYFFGQIAFLRAWFGME